MNNVGQIIFAFVYITALVCYFFSETSGNFKRRAINKTILALMFLINSAISLISKGLTPFTTILFLAIVFSALGDIVLLFSFTKGGVLFIVANVCYAIYLMTHYFYYNINWLYAIAVLFLALTTYTIMVKKQFLKLKLFSIYSGYILSVSMQGSLGASLFLQASTLAERLIGLGLLFFLISDFFLFIHKFHQKKDYIIRINSGFYFTGMLLITFYCYFM